MARDRTGLAEHFVIVRDESSTRSPFHTTKHRLVRLFFFFDRSARFRAIFHVLPLLIPSIYLYSLVVDETPPDGPWSVCLFPFVEC